MLSERKQRAVALLFEYSEVEVAERLKITQRMLREWMAEMEFQTAIGDEMRSNRQTSVRRLSRLYVDACQELFEIIHEKEDKNRHRVIVDILKVSGLLKDSMLEESGGGPDPIQAMLAGLMNDDEEKPSEESEDGDEE